MADARPWINIPHLADADLIARFAAAPGAMIEYSNEVWNTQFAQGKWAQNQATAAGITKATFIAREMALVAKKLVRVGGAKLLVGYQPTVREDGWKEFATALVAAGGSSDNIAGVITSCYPTGGLNSLAAIRPYVAADDRAGVLKKLAEDIEANTALRYRSARQLADALGGIALDPCTDPDNPTRAERFYHLPDDGCSLPWDARNVFCNPPYGEARNRWVERCIEAGKVSKVVLLIPSHTETRIFQTALEACSSVLFFKARLRFGVLRENRRQEAASHGSALFGFGVDLTPLRSLGVPMVRA